MMHTDETEASRALFERLVIALNQSARDEGYNDNRLPEDMLARDPNDPNNYNETDVNAIWYGWCLHTNYSAFLASGAVHGKH